jgi:hypothetical protein
MKKIILVLFLNLVLISCWSGKQEDVIKEQKVEKKEIVQEEVNSINKKDIIIEPKKEEEIGEKYNTWIISGVNINKNIDDIINYKKIWSFYFSYKNDIFYKKYISDKKKDEYIKIDWDIKTFRYVWAMISFIDSTEFYMDKNGIFVPYGGIIFYWNTVSFKWYKGNQLDFLNFKKYYTSNDFYYTDWEKLYYRFNLMEWINIKWMNARYFSIIWEWYWYSIYKNNIYFLDKKIWEKYNNFNIKSYYDLFYLFNWDYIYTWNEYIWFRKIDLIEIKKEINKIKNIKVKDIKVDNIEVDNIEDITLYWWDIKYKIILIIDWIKYESIFEIVEEYKLKNISVKVIK